MTLEAKVLGKYRGIYAATECDLLCRIVPKAQYAMTEDHCSIQLGVWGCKESLFLMEDKFESSGLINFVKCQNVHTEQTTQKLS